MDVSDYTLVALPAASGIVATIGGVMLTLPTPNYRAVKGAFWAAAICFGVLGLVWGATATNQSLFLRMAIAGITAAAAAMALTWILSILSDHDGVTQPQQQARFQVIKIDISAPRPKLSATASITVINKGDIAATNLVYSWSTITSDRILTADEEDKVYINAIQALQSLDKGAATEYNHDEGLMLPIELPALTNEQYNSVIAGKLRFYLLIVFAYKDRNTPTGKKLITEDCNQFFSSFERRSCHGHTRTYLSGLN